MLDNDVLAVNRVFADFCNHALPDGENFSVGRGGKVDALVLVYVPGDRALPLAEGAGKLVRAEGETEA
jgi:hypothetical protein